MSNYDENTLRMALIGLESEKNRIERMLTGASEFIAPPRRGRPPKIARDDTPQRAPFSLAHRRALSRAQKKRWKKRQRATKK